MTDKSSKKSRSGFRGTARGAGDTRTRGSLFTRFSGEVARLAGRPEAVVLAVGIIIVWAATGPIFGFNDTWQLVINTGTTIITFLMVFVIQASQNRDTAAMHLKLDELIRAIEPAQNALLDIDNLDETVLENLRKRYRELASQASCEADIVEAIEAQERQRAGGS